VSRVDDLRKLDQALSRINRISTGRVSSRNRSERSGVLLSRPAISILGALHASGPVRLSSLARLTGLEAPLISREIKDLGDGGYVFRSSDPTDGRAGIVELSPKGIDAWNRYRHAADDINGETFSEWSSDDLRTLRVLLERVARDVSKGSSTLRRQSQAS
jgi:DNA-binding MarR family transcriptional regulator